jgi:negative regulator of sigma E activity
MDTRQNLSRLIDGDLSGEALDELLDRLQSSPALQAELADLYATRDATRAALAHDEFSMDSGFAARVHAEIAAEPLASANASAPDQANVISIGAVSRRDPDAPPSADSTPRPNRFVGFAIAASVALAAVAIGYRMLPLETFDGVPLSAEIAPSQRSSPAVQPTVAQVAAVSPDARQIERPAENRSDRWDVRNHALEQRLKGYLVEHSEYVGRGMHGMHPYARVVSYQNDTDDPRIESNGR